MNTINREIFHSYILKTFLFYVVLGLYSCKAPNPETIAGIKLGLPVKKQIENARLNKTLAGFGNEIYLPLSNEIKGSPRFWTMDIGESEPILHEVWLYFASKAYQSSDINCINKDDKDIVISLYENKYGSCRKWRESSDINEDRIKSISDDGVSSVTYHWIKGNLNIGLYISTNDERPGTFRMHAVYSYDIDYKRTLESKSKDKLNKI